jgi:hypothetical protein
MYRGENGLEHEISLTVWRSFEESIIGPFVQVHLFPSSHIVVWWGLIFKRLITFVLSTVTPGEGISGTCWSGSWVCPWIWGQWRESAASVGNFIKVYTILAHLLNFEMAYEYSHCKLIVIYLLTSITPWQRERQRATACVRLNFSHRVLSIQDQPRVGLACLACAVE